MIQPHSLARLQQILATVDGEIDGWLMFDFRGTNPIMAAVIGPEVVGTRRSYVYIPRDGTPVALVHAIDGENWRSWPSKWTKHVWVTRDQLDALVPAMVGGRRVAVEYSPRGAIPYLDDLPIGVSEFLRESGATLLSSRDLVTRYLSVWDAAGYDAHVRAAEKIAQIGVSAIRLAGERARGGDPLSEVALADWIVNAFDRAGVKTEWGPSVCYGANAARNHYEPTEAESARIVPGQLLLVDLWATESDGIYADQTWMGSIGAPSERAVEIWNVVRESRDAAIDLLRTRLGAGEALRGAQVDRAAKDVIAGHGLLQYTQCRTGHSIDRFGLHGYGPTIDDTETYDDRLLIPGVGFSIEPGVYIPGEIGVRSEVNGVIREDGVVITPGEYQQELIVV
jgi:Xaa-Pro aminopeptidase